MVQIGQMYCVPGSVVRSGHDKADPHNGSNTEELLAQVLRASSREVPFPGALPEAAGGWLMRERLGPTPSSARRR